jgi:hypothetical protein
MAGDWIKFELATIDKPEVLQMADLLNITSDDVVGKLLRVWGWFDQRSVNGDAGGVTDVTLMKFIDRHVGMVGFAACMKKVGWLTNDGLPNFDRHNGETAKNRALTKKRMKKMRNADVTQEASPEKRREEKKETTPPDGGFGRFWEMWPSTERKVAKTACVKVWNRKHLDPDADQIVAHVRAAKETDSWKRGFEPAPLTYLNQERWKDGNVAKPALPSYT